LTGIKLVVRKFQTQAITRLKIWDCPVQSKLEWYGVTQVVLSSFAYFCAGDSQPVYRDLSFNLFSAIDSFSSG